MKKLLLPLLLAAGFAVPVRAQVILPSGETMSVCRVWDLTNSLAIDASGRITCNAGTGTFTVAGGKTNDNAAPGATNVGVLPAVATAAAPTYTTGNLVMLSTDLSGALRVSGGGGGTQYAEDTAHVSGDLVNMCGVVQQSADASLSTDGDRSLLQVDANGYLKVNIKAGAGSGGTASTFGAAFPATGTAAGFSDGTNMQGGRVFDLDSGAGTQYGLGANLRKIASGGSVEAGTSSDPLRVDPTGSTTQPVSGTVTANQGGAPWSVAGPVAHDAVGTSTNPLLVGGYASAAAPADVSADGDAVRSWHLRSGAAVFQPTFAGVLATTGNGASGTGVQRVTIANDSTGILAAVTSITNTVTVQGAKTNNNAAPGATNVGVLPALANTSAPTYIDGDQVLLSTDLTGALRVSGGSGGTQYAEDTAHVSGDLVNMAGVVQQTADASLSTDGDRSLLQVDSSGFLKVNVKAGGGTGGTSSTFGAAFPATGTAAGFFDGTNMQGARVIDADTTGSTFWTLPTNLVFRTGGTPVEAGTSANPLRVDPTGTTTQPVSVPGTVVVLSNFLDNAAFTPGTSRVTTIGAEVDDVATSAATEGSAGIPRMSANRILYMQPSDGTGAKTPFDMDLDTSAGTANRQSMGIAGAFGGGPSPIGASTGAGSAGDEIGLVVRNFGTSPSLGNVAWTSATAINTAISAQVHPFSMVGFTLTRTGTVTSGTLNFECTMDGSSTWFPWWFTSMNATTMLVTETFTMSSPVDTTFVAAAGPCTGIRARLNPTIAGAGTITIQALSDSLTYSPWVAIGNQVTLATGTNTIGALTANQSVNLAQVAGATTVVGSGTATGALRVELANNGTGVMTSVGSITTAVTPGTAAANLGKAEDAAAVSGDTGVAWLAQRKDTNSTLASADADYVVPAADNYGVLSISTRHPNAIRCTQTVSTATTLTVMPGCTAPGAGLSIYVTGIQFSSNAQGIAADAFPTLKYGTGGACGTGTTVWWGCFLTAATQANCTFDPDTAIKIPANNEICWMNSTAGSKFVVITGFIAP